MTDRPSPAARTAKPLTRRAADFVRWRTRPLRGWLKHGPGGGLQRWRLRDHPPLLHVGCGMQRLDGWLNLDLQKLPEVDRALDVTRGLPYRDVRAVFAEHFLEHLAADDALAFLDAVHRCLAGDGRLRLTTPNLDWVWRHLYRADAPTIDDALRVNRAFYGWHHRFLWNRPLLADALAACGFVAVTWPARGESRWPLFRGIERHETYDDTPDCPHVLIVEATRGAAQPDARRALGARLERDFVRFLRGT